VQGPVCHATGIDANPVLIAACGQGGGGRATAAGGFTRWRWWSLRHHDAPARLRRQTWDCHGLPATVWRCNAPAGHYASLARDRPIGRRMRIDISKRPTQDQTEILGMGRLCSTISSGISAGCTGLFEPGPLQARPRGLEAAVERGCRNAVGLRPGSRRMTVIPCKNAALSLGR